MIHSSWVWVAWVDRARSGSATLSDAMAAVTAPSARQTTAVTAVVLTRREAPGRNLVAKKASSPATIAMITMAPHKRRKIRFAHPRRPCRCGPRQERIFLLYGSLV